LDLKKLEQSHSEVCNRLEQDIGYYNNQKQQLIAFVEGFKGSNKKYSKIRAIAEEHIDRFLADQKILVSAAVLATIEALRMHPINIGSSAVTTAIMIATVTRSQMILWMYCHKLSQITVMTTITSLVI
jgi:hypothetical protein